MAESEPAQPDLTPGEVRDSEGGEVFVNQTARLSVKNQEEHLMIRALDWKRLKALVGKAKDALDVGRDWALFCCGISVSALLAFVVALVRSEWVPAGVAASFSFIFAVVAYFFSQYQDRQRTSVKDRLEDVEEEMDRLHEITE